MRHDIIFNTVKRLKIIKKIINYSIINIIDYIWYIILIFSGKQKMIRNENLKKIDIYFFKDLNKIINDNRKNNKKEWKLNYFL